MDHLNLWLHNYKHWSDGDDTVPELDVLSRGVIANNESILWNFDFGDGMSIIHVAIERNHYTVVMRLINTLPADAIYDLVKKKNKYGNTAIRDAVFYNRHGILRNVLSSVRAKSLSVLQLLLISDRAEWTAAHFAAELDNYKVMDSVLDSLNYSERLQLLISTDRSGSTALYIAVLYKSLQTVRIIREQLTRADWYQLMKVQNGKGSMTVLHAVAYNNNLDIVSSLLDPLTDVQKIKILELKTNMGFTAKDWAVRVGHTDIADLLEEITITTMIRLFIVTDEIDGKLVVSPWKLLPPQPMHAPLFWYA